MNRTEKNKGVKNKNEDFWPEGSWVRPQKKPKKSHTNQNKDRNNIKVAIQYYGVVVN